MLCCDHPCARIVSSVQHSDKDEHTSGKKANGAANWPFKQLINCPRNQQRNNNGIREYEGSFVVIVSNRQPVFCVRYTQPTYPKSRHSNGKAQFGEGNEFGV